MNTQIIAAVLLMAVIGGVFLQAQTPPTLPEESAHAMAVEFLKATAQVYLKYMAEHEGMRPESLFDLSGEFPADFPTQMLSYLQTVRQDRLVAEDAVSTIPMLADRHSLPGHVGVAFGDGHVEVMRDGTFAELVAKHGLVLSDQRQVALECRVLTGSSQFSDAIGIALPGPDESAGRVLSGAANDTVIRVMLYALPPVVMDLPLQDALTLDDLQAGFLLRAAQQRRDWRQLTAPKAVVLNSERATLAVHTAVVYTDTDGRAKSFHKGIRLDVQPTIEEDGQSIRLKGYFRMVDVRGEETQVVDGHEFLIPVVEIIECQFHRIVPNRATAMLSTIFDATTDAESLRHYMLLVKPSVVVEPMQGY